MKRKILCLTAGLLLAHFSVQAQDYQQLYITSGFNEKMIAYSNLPASASTTNSIDNEDRGLMNTSFSTVWGMPGPSYALPVDGLINSLATEGLTFQLAAANTSNALRIADTNGTGTLEVNSGPQANIVYLLATSGSGNATISATVDFTDNTSQLFTGVVVPNWFGGAEQPIAAKNFGYVKREMNIIDNPDNDPRLFQIALELLPENHTKTIKDIVITKTSAEEGVVNIFGATAQIGEACPTPAPTAENQVSCAGTTLSGLAVTGAEGAVFTWYDAQMGGNILDPELPIMDQTYYVSQTADGCESHRTAITVTVNPGPHAPDGEENQNFTEGETVGDLEVSFEDDTTPIWYTVNDAGESMTVSVTTPLEDGMTYYVAQMLDGCRSEALRITAHMIMGTGSHTANVFVAYPNPAGESITVSGNEAITGIAVTNLLGQRLFTQKANDTSAVVDLSGLAAGNYILTLTTAEGATATQKLVKK